MNKNGLPEAVRYDQVWLCKIYYVFSNKLRFFEVMKMYFACFCKKIEVHLICCDFWNLFFDLFIKN